MPHVDFPQSQVRFAAARADITPPLGIYWRMWGAATHDHATGVHRPLTATAGVFEPLAIADAGGMKDRLALVSPLNPTAVRFARWRSSPPSSAECAPETESC